MYHTTMNGLRPAEARGEVKNNPIERERSRGSRGDKYANLRRAIALGSSATEWYFSSSQLPAVPLSELTPRSNIYKASFRSSGFFQVSGMINIV